MNVTIPYEDFTSLKSDSTKLENVKKLLETEFPDDTCQLIAVKGILGIEIKEDVPSEPVDPSDPSDPTGGTDPSGDPSGSGSDPSGDPSTP